MNFIMRLFLLTTFLTGFSQPVLAREVTPVQFLFTIRRIFPDEKNLNVFISKSKLEKEKPMLVRAAAQNKFKVKIHVIENSADIGRGIKDIDDNSVLLLIDSPVLENRKNRLYILKKCKEKKVSIVTSSKDYSDSGALLALLVNNENKIDVIINLKHSEHLKARFTEAFIQQNGIKQVIQ